MFISMSMAKLQQKKHSLSPMSSNRKAIKRVVGNFNNHFPTPLARSPFVGNRLNKLRTPKNRISFTINLFLTLLSTVGLAMLAGIRNSNLAHNSLVHLAISPVRFFRSFYHFPLRTAWHPLYFSVGAIHSTLDNLLTNAHGAPYYPL